MKKNLLIISIHFYPEQFRINDIALELKERGYKVKVVTGIPNYPVGKIYKGYGFFKKRRENWNGIRIERLLIIPRGRSKFKLFLNYISFVISGYFWALREKEKHDIILVYAVSPIFQALPALKYAKRYNVPCYLYLQDLWPDSLIVAGGVKNKFIISAVSKVVNFIHQKSTKIFVTSQSMRETLLQRNVPDEKIIYLPQYAEEFYVPLEKKEINEIDVSKFNITYTGNIGYVQGLDILPKAAKILKEKGITNVVFNIVGDGRYKRELIELIKSLGVEDLFRFIDIVPATRIPEILAASDIALLSYMPNELLSKYIPAKLQTYMACGKPIIAVADGETKRIIQEAKCGRCVRPGEPNELVDAIVNFLNAKDETIMNLGRNARRYYEENFDKNKIIDKLENIFLGRC
ncbi:MAG: glycosyltransferase family 4 protein [bacterium]|nr:glycosyltransferase family 4 protein [bacterium]